MAKFDIRREDTWATDETGIQPESGQKERVIGKAGEKSQYQQRSRSQENITVIVTICADGSSIAPAVIFKGLINILNIIRISYSKKGWVDGKIGVQWIEDFDKKTKAKADGQYCLLLVDGHVSHYTCGFLKYAREHKIVVLCYPAPSTHVYQGLDIAVFSVLKRAWSDERDQFTCETGGVVSKTNFLAIYGHAHLKALTKPTIISAFAKTGVWPFNSQVITPAMMALSHETSRQAAMPVAPSSPVKA
ncbi:DDE-domain-containing protein, partial [Stereum hirsutum FP-91666 SS1]|uniref:DDE-domain-containing protein n=1 Tax=Stereum hirsutum (strain FP-91666) TaxID=721885 RepID=UPI000440D72D